MQIRSSNTYKMNKPLWPRGIKVGCTLQNQSRLFTTCTVSQGRHNRVPQTGWHLSSHSPAGWRSEVSLLLVDIPPETCWGAAFLISCSFRGLSAMLGVPRFADTALQSLPLLSIWLSLSSQGIFFFLGRPVILNHGLPNDLMLTSLHLQRPYFQRRSHS